MPPVLAVKAPSVIDGNTVTLKGQVTDDVQVKDLFVRVYNKSSKLPAKKVFYLPNRGEKNKLPFSGRRAAVAGVEHHPGVRPRDHRGPERRHADRHAQVRAQRRPGARPKDNPGSATGTKPAIQNGRSGMTTR